MANDEKKENEKVKAKATEQKQEKESPPAESASAPPTKKPAASGVKPTLDMDKLAKAVAEQAERFKLTLPDFGQLNALRLSDIERLRHPKLHFDLSPHYSKLQEQIAALRRRSDEQARALTEEKTSGAEKERQIRALQATLAELQAKEKLGFLLNRVNQEAQRKLLQSTDFQNQFLNTRECDAIVMAVDIRRSTELMLKARTPEDFAGFITTLCSNLMQVIVDSYGVFDKFTGDGVLAFFPEFYSGLDAAYYAVAAADRCHSTFKDHYHRSRKSFTSILTDIGLGIGIDYGPVHLVQVAGGLTVVGAPVVYACRLSGAPSGFTLANQPAYEVMSDRFGGSCFAAERELEIKHEGRMLAYEVKLNSRPYTPANPVWREESASPQPPDAAA